MRISLFLICFACMFISGCEDTSIRGNTGTAVYVGNGIVYTFPAKNGFGTDIFHNSLNQFLAQHLELRVACFLPIEHNSSKDVTQYMVIFTKIPETVSSPTTLPVEVTK